MSEFARPSAGFPEPNAASTAGLQAHVLDAMSEALGIAVIIYDGHDQIVHAGRQVRQYFPVPPEYLKPGTRLRDFLGAVYDSGSRQAGQAANREEWIAERIAAHWRERSDIQEKDGHNHWLRFSKRRLPSGYGICVVSDITEQKKREDQWRADMERVQLTEEILDNLPCPIFVQDRGLTFVAVNKSFCALRATQAEELLGGTVGSAFGPDIAPRVEVACRHTLETGVPSWLVERLTRPDGEEAMVSIRTLRVGKPGRYFLVTTVQDMAELHPGMPAGQPFMAGAQPVTSAERLTPRDPSAGCLAGRRVLVVAANPAFEVSCLDSVRSLGAEACSVRDATETEAFFDLACSVGLAIDLAIVDTDMDMQCLELAEKHAGKVLALDGFQLQSEFPMLLAGHFAAAAPADLGEDWEISTGSEPVASDPQEVGQTVLVAEDNEINQIVFSQILEGLGYRYKIVADGEEAVRAWQELRPAIVLMDLTLPGLNGIEATRRIRQLGTAQGVDTPVIGVLVQAFDNSRDDCLAAGMNEVIVKPISPDIIEAVFQRLAPQLAFRASR